MSAPEKIFVTVEYIGKTDTVVCGAFCTSPMDESVEYTRTDLSQASVAAALEAAAAKLQNVADNWDCGHNESRLCDCAPYVEQWGLAADEIRALITPNQRTTLQAAHVAAEVAKARAEDAADSFAMLIADARAEAGRAMTKFPQPNYVISKFAEEAGEVVKAAIHYAENRETADNVRGEMKQAIAMIYRLWVEGDQVHGMKPLAQIGAKP